MSESPDRERNDDDARRRAGNIRDHLANERTLLSWIRLGLGLVALGFVLARFAIFLQVAEGGHAVRGTHHFTVAIGTAMVLLGPLFSGAAAYRFFAAEREIDTARATPHHGLIYVLLIAVGLTGLVLAAYLLSVSLT